MSWYVELAFEIVSSYKLSFWQTFYVNHKILKDEFQTHCWCNHHLFGYFRWSIYECSWHIDSFENAKEDEVI